MLDASVNVHALVRLMNDYVDGHVGIRCFLTEWCARREHEFEAHPHGAQDYW